MPPPSRAPLPKAAQPKHGRNFDPWNAVSLGHQRAETKGPQGWRENRTWKLHSQLAAGNTGGTRLSDAVGHGSEDFDEERNMLVPKEVKTRAAKSVMDMLQRPGTMKPRNDRSMSPGGKRHEEEQHSSSSSSKIFSGLVIYVNGSTHPLISDHKLKHILVEHGARMSIHLGRRQVTHVILGRPSGPNSVGVGAGGGLAGGKLEKEVRRVGGRGIKFVGVEWVLESLKAGRRLPEARFATLKVASKGQASVLGAFAKKPAS
ncbi:hypothetical protein M406DRAFT_296682 [Cryphonectria parasitica EP155]|uniref:BRCT domain-containing protein n=1 Tax=Cryphonectria parasitica (strain ATCC 38755 / EP155) TaxID=660469 RepID=A0A9P4XUH6_CRYP1|nr:uncharacterized protein M406DRAFT_296682 [Cryphonectria parasitica EP155]KAF3761123.1 hypothetical protein M406DRAFT_296682 [Cryphonectria parasitica EP155]